MIILGCFALTAQYLPPGASAVAFFGEGALNQGMLLDLRTVSPLDKRAVRKAVKQSGRLLVAVDEDYAGFGLSGELSTAVSGGWYILQVWPHLH